MEPGVYSGAGAVPDVQGRASLHALPEEIDSGDPRAYVQGMERLIEVVRDLASARSLDEVVDIVRHAARALVNADGATFVLREEGNCYYVDEDAIAPLWRGLRFPMESCVSGWAMLHQQAVAIPDIYLDERVPHDAYRPTFVKAMTITPIRTADPVGAIGTYWATNHEAAPTELRLLQALADSTAVAIESVRVLNELEARVEQRTAQLTAANADLRQFAAVTAHDLRNPLTTLSGFAQVLSAQTAGEEEGPTKVAIDAINRTTGRLITMVDDLLAFARTGASEVSLAPVDLDELLASVVAELDSQISDTGATIESAPLGVVVADPTLLQQAIQNLVSNALCYTTEDNAPRVRVTRDDRDGAVHIAVEDNGPGVPAEERERILEPFTRGSASQGRAGSGLGLAICRRVAEHHGGRLEIGDAPDGGAVFTFVLPQP